MYNITDTLRNEDEGVSYGTCVAATDLIDLLRAELAALREQDDALYAEHQRAEIAQLNHDLDQANKCFEDAREQWVQCREELAALREQVTDADNLIAEWKPHMYCEHGRLRTYECEQCSIPVPSQDDTRDAAIKHIASVAHDGGLRCMDSYDALVVIRKLSLPYWKRDCLPSEAGRLVDAAILAAKAQEGK
jgi:FtsZ-binding cell division protein ZapB